MEELKRLSVERTSCLRRNCTLWIVFLTFIIISPIQDLTAQPAVNNPFTVVLDAGHGGKDPGAVGKKSYEKNIALAITKKVGYYIESLMPDVKVIYTRKTDVFVDLDVRASIANKAAADLFLSIHVDGVGTPNAWGTSTYVMGSTKDQKNLDLAMKENAAIKYEKDFENKYRNFDLNNPAIVIELSAKQNAFNKQSLDFASRVQDQFRTRAKRRDRGVHPGPFMVLWQTTMPSVLVETGYITNPDEEKFLNTDYGQDLVASSVYRAFRDYKTDIEANTASESNEPAAVFSSQMSTESLNPKVENVIEEKKEAVNKIITPPKEENKVVAKPKVDKPKTDVKAESKAAKQVKSASTNNSGIIFRVQVLASRNPVPSNSKDLKGFKIFEQMKEGDYYKYVTKANPNYQECADQRKTLLKSFPGAFVVAYKKGVKIPLRQAIEEASKN